ncbi:OmpH family outer membrane protein [Ruegeria sp. HKCCD7318]|uniref:OmpH family outer membrane protein n=2 Tax=Ruegeria TaxID=97050 RepID=UPI001488756D|nr:OmpH family outer membrane protein [Ruegeria sp. HKCCD7318]NOD46303.1 OmpH family outer membrane protein [Ruegeria sp. HKCCD5849]NOD50397.1 OmpH family outer membrane protein [Ruegeria sp. HKCCD5851]NOD67213.1 OmpH family outer membrane protein [Ruegeria sp. HKCCD7303]NOE32802.1 OmpH family outer membrane protein [Ruegeria sp. HKCCD7318]
MLDKIMRTALGPFGALCLLSVVLTAPLVSAQQLGVPQASVVTLSSEELFSKSAFGQRVRREVEKESALLAEENERIVVELSQEEKELTEQRATLPAEEFRPLAEAFDSKVQSHREGQRAKLDALARRSEEAQQTFFEIVRPILVDLLREFGASVMIERSNVVVSTTDITDAAIARIDAAIGDGSSLQEGNGE